MEITDTKLYTIHDWYCSAMGEIGKKVKVPRCKDPTKSYRFRAIKQYADRCYNEFKLDDLAVKYLTYDIVKYAKNHGLLNKGAQMFNMSSVIDICYYTIKDILESESSLVLEIKYSHDFLMEQLEGKNNLVRLLLEPSRPGGYSNLVYWHNLNYLTANYIALSKPCLKALGKIKKEERSELPEDVALLSIAMQILSNSEISQKIKTVLGKDLRILPF